MPEEVDGQLCLRQEEVPSVWWKRRVDTGQNGDKVGLERLDGSFSFVATVHVGWDKSVGAFMGFDGQLVSFTGFVIQLLLGDMNVAGFEASHDFVICGDAMMVGLGLEWLDKDCIGPGVVCQHDILVAALCADWETAHVVGVQGVNFFLPAEQGRVGDQLHGV